jgi:hypothetical protein
LFSEIAACTPGVNRENQDKETIKVLQGEYSVPKKPMESQDDFFRSDVIEAEYR